MNIGFGGVITQIAQNDGGGRGTLWCRGGGGIPTPWRDGGRHGNVAIVGFVVVTTTVILIIIIIILIITFVKVLTMIVLQGELTGVSCRIHHVSITTIPSRILPSGQPHVENVVAMNVRASSRVVGIPCLLLVLVVVVGSSSTSRIIIIILHHRSLDNDDARQEI